MDIQTLITAFVILMIAMGLVSLFFKKEDRKNVLIASLLFIGFGISSLLVIGLIQILIPEAMEWLRWVLGIIGYIFVLSYFGDKMTNLTRRKKNSCEPVAPGNCGKTPPPSPRPHETQPPQ